MGHAGKFINKRVLNRFEGSSIRYEHVLVLGFVQLEFGEVFF